MHKNNVMALRKKEVRQSLALTEATYELSRDERRILYLAAIQCAENVSLDGQQNIPITEYEIKVSDYSDMFEVDVHESSRDVRKAITNIYDKSVIIADPDESVETERSEEEVRWIIGKKNLPKRGSWSITLNPLILPHLTDLANRIRFPMGSVVYLQNTYQYRLYELFMAEPSGKRVIELDWLREKFCLKPSYEVYTNLRQRIIDPAVKQINKTTSMKLKYKENKIGKKIISLTFSYKIPAQLDK
ncbi:plasmid replication initiation protein Rep [Colwellia chukchiensis]|uniref:Plasmid replication initiation protein Rep n=1 Tax=Colwellia chukchiensis TaxID=641665 RepID=A0A1H7TZW9_9GAMM|nr:RepB family plasmid replication initiator protein [Colwellia chukchiensis]SEL89956.1 plasmid replication initiation protein Rep [Colwellia chukchiensis]